MTEQTLGHDSSTGGRMKPRLIHVRVAPIAVMMHGVISGRKLRVVDDDPRDEALIIKSHGPDRLRCGLSVRHQILNDTQREITVVLVKRVSESRDSYLEHV